MAAKDVPKFIWNGLYPTWKEACDAAKGMGDGGGYNSDGWFQRITKQLIDYRQEFEKFGIAMPPRPCNLPLVCSLIKPKTIVDFGGSSAWTWDYIVNSIPENGIKSYTVIEKLEVQEFMKNSKLHEKHVIYADLEEVKDCDLLYANAVLQYFESNEVILDLLKRTTPEYILFDGLVAKDDEDFFTVQTFYDSGIPFRFLGLSKFISELNALDYQVQFKGPYLSPFFGIIQEYQMSNFPENFRLRYALSILLKKVK